MSKKCKPLLGKARRLLMGNSHKTTGAWPERGALYAKEPAWAAAFSCAFSDDSALPDELFDLNSTRDCWNSFAGGQKELAGDVEKLMQLHVLLRLRAGMQEAVSAEDVVGAPDSNRVRSGAAMTEELKPTAV